jgi:8-oxo-dGTP diphosphatase
VLLQRYNTGYADGKYALPSGHLNGDELASTAAIRETREETGVHIAAKDLTCVHITHHLNRQEDGQERIHFFFETYRWTGEPKNKEPDKCTDLQWFSMTNPPKETAPYIKSVLKRILAGKFYSEYVADPKR